MAERLYKTRAFTAGVWLASTACGAGCSADAHPASPAPLSARASSSSAWEADGDTSSRARYGQWANPLDMLGTGPEQTARVCAREGSDKVRDLFCGHEPAQLTSLVELEEALGLAAESIGTFVNVSLNAHSTALSTRSVSAINPRALLSALELDGASGMGGGDVDMQGPQKAQEPKDAHGADKRTATEAQAQAQGQELIVLGFARGEQYAELVVRDRLDKELRFYVVAFEQACNDAAQGCLPGDLLTEAIETDWREVTLYDEVSMANTTFDCATCHQPDGPGTPKLLRMQELVTPWTHWLFRYTDGGNVLFEDFFAARGDEPYAGLPRDSLERSSPSALSALTKFAGTKSQPNMFESHAIEREVRESAAALGGVQPADNSVPGDSPTWRVVYDRAKRGEAIAVPYHDVKVTDAEKLARMTEAYQAYRRGELPRQHLPDIRDVFPDDPQRLAEMGMATEPGLDGEAVLRQACSQCHNARLDQSLSRARFRPDLQAMSPEEKQLAVQRLRLPPDDPFAMPPAQLRVLSPEARERAIAALLRDMP